MGVDAYITVGEVQDLHPFEWQLPLYLHPLPL
jgi:hypothetical protein